MAPVAASAQTRERPRVPAHTPADPVLHLESSSDVEIDLGMMVHDLLPVLLDGMRESGTPKAQEGADRLASVLDLTGLTSLDRVRVRSQTGIDFERTRATITLMPDEASGLIGSLLAIPPARAEFGRYLSDEDVAMLVSVPTWAEDLAAIADFLERPDVKAALSGPKHAKRGAPSDSLLSQLQLKRDILPLLSGELDFVEFARQGSAPGLGAEPDTTGETGEYQEISAGDPGAGMAGVRRAGKPPRPDVALVIGAHDGVALRDKMLDMAGRIVGALASRMSATAGGDSLGDAQAQAQAQQRAAMMAMASGFIAGLRSLPGEKHGEFTFQTLPGGIAIATSPEWLIVTTAPARLESIVEEPRAGLAIPKCRAYCYCDGGALLENLVARVSSLGRGGAARRSAAGSSAAAALHDRIAAVIADAAAHGQNGTFETIVTSRPDRWDIDQRRSGRITRTGYSVLREVVAALPALHAENARKKAAAEAVSDIKAAVSAIDDAMTRYGKDHHGTFPKDPRVLADGNYLQAFPDLKPTPPGEYLYHGFSYIPLADSNGDIVGYYLFAYGGGERTGYDVFTPEALSALQYFMIESDGQPDGVAAFSYGGTAIAQVEAWKEIR